MKFLKKYCIIECDIVTCHQLYTQLSYTNNYVLYQAPLYKSCIEAKQYWVSTLKLLQICIRDFNIYTLSLSTVHHTPTCTKGYKALPQLYGTSTAVKWVKYVQPNTRQAITTSYKVLFALPDILLTRAAVSLETALAFPYFQHKPTAVVGRSVT